MRNYILFENIFLPTSKSMFESSREVSVRGV